MLNLRTMFVTTASLLGLLGLLGMTWIFPATGRFLLASKARRSASAAKCARPSRLSILVPAHNEELCILESLRSIESAILAARAEFPSLEARIVVGADGCTDRTSEIARRFGAAVVESKQGRGKWATLNALARDCSDADWIIFADCGAVWEPSLLLKCLPLCAEPEVIGVAPAYRNPSAGVFEALSWAMESFLKRMEDEAGGPVSVHGATVMYRRDELMGALEYLSRDAWLNDDVVIPLTLRMLNPGARIRYAHEARVHDSPSAHVTGGEPVREFGRRRRMVRGNIQWIRGILPEGWRRNPTVAYLALRRVFRVFWAWWGVIAALPFAYLAVHAASELPSGGWLIGAIAGALFVVGAYRYRRPLLGVLDAALASLLAPLFFFSGPQTRWK